MVKPLTPVPVNYVVRAMHGRLRTRISASEPTDADLFLCLCFERKQQRNATVGLDKKKLAFIIKLDPLLHSNIAIIYRAI